MFIAFSPSVTPAACHLLPSCGVPILFMRLEAPHKIDRCANRCFLYPPQAAVAYVAHQRKALFCEHFHLMKAVGTALAAVRNPQKLVATVSRRFFGNKKMTEGFLQKHIKLTLQSLRLTFVRHLPLHKGG